MNTCPKRNGEIREELCPVGAENSDSFGVGSDVEFGSYFQKDKENKTSISWRVLANDGEKALLLSNYGLACKQYNEKYADVTWGKCTLREWLNEEFFNCAFSEEEKNKIVTVSVSSDDHLYYNIKQSPATQDRVFC